MAAGHQKCKAGTGPLAGVSQYGQFKHKWGKMGQKLVTQSSPHCQPRMRTATEINPSRADAEHKSILNTRQTFR